MDRITEFGWEGAFGGYSVAGRHSQSDLDVAKRIVIDALRPADNDVVIAEVSRMRMLTKARSDDTAGMVAVAFAEELDDYPNDVVVSACRSWPNTNKFFPAWAELRELCEEEIAERRYLLRALETAEVSDA